MLATCLREQFTPDLGYQGGLNANKPRNLVIVERRAIDKVCHNESVFFFPRFFSPSLRPLFSPLLKPFSSAKDNRSSMICLLSPAPQCESESGVHGLAR